MGTEILSLRRAGQTDQGIALGEQKLAAQQTDIWDCRGLFWCYYDKVKHLTDNGSIAEAKLIVKRMDSLIGMLDGDQTAIANLERIKRTVLPEYAIILQAKNMSKESEWVKDAYGLIVPLFDTAHESLHEDLGWVLYRYIKSQLDTLSSVEIRLLLARYMKLGNPRPSMLHSQVLKQALSLAKNHDDFIFDKFFELWNPENFRVEDYQSSFYNGQSYDPLVEQAVRQIANSKAPYSPKELHEKLNTSRISLARVVAIYRECIFWMLNSISKSGNKNELWNGLNKYISIYGQFPGDEYHSKILLIGLRNATESYQSALIPFSLGWGLRNLRSEDWMSEKDKDGNEYSCVAVKFLSSIYDWFKVEANRKVETITEFIPLFQEGSHRLTSDHWPKYRYAKMLLWGGYKDMALSLFKSLSANLSTQSYYWQDLAMAVYDPQTKCDLLLKAISLQKDENFLGTARLEVATLLIELGEKSHAKIELGLYRFYRNSVGKPLNTAFSQLWEMVRDSPVDEQAHKEFVKKRCNQAEEILFEDFPWQEAVIADFWKQDDGKEYISLISTDGQSYKTPKNKFKAIMNSKRGQVVGIRIDSQIPAKPVVVMVRLAECEHWSIFPQRVGVVGNRLDDGTAFVYMSDSTQSIRIERSNLQVGVGVSFRLLEKNHGGKKHMIAESIFLLSDDEWKKQFPAAQVVVDNVNQDKRLYHFIGLNRLDGIIRFKDSNEIYHVGDGLEITYFQKANKDGKISVGIIDCKRMSTPSPELVKKVDGKISVPTDFYGVEKNFGFLDNCFISPKFLPHASNGQNAKGRAILTKEGKWRVFELEVEEYFDDFYKEPADGDNFKDIIMDKVKSYYMIGVYHQDGQGGYFEDLRGMDGERIEDFDGKSIEKRVYVSYCDLIESEFYEFMWDIEGESKENYNFICLGNIHLVDKTKLLQISQSIYDQTDSLCQSISRHKGD